MNRLDDPFTLTTSILVLTMSAVMCVVVSKMYAAMRTMDDEDYDPKRVRRQMKFMLIATGAWQVTIGLFLASMGQWTNTIALIGMGSIIVVAAHYNVFTGMRDL